MTPLDFLNEEFESVQRALRETLRHDYGPDQSGDYYRECEFRLKGFGAEIPTIASTDTVKIQAYLSQLSNVSNFVSLIERSRLGEFSWPFADELRRISKILLMETNLKGETLDPIIHVVAEGQGYRITYEQQIPITSSRRRFLVVAFPRSLKHHVLLHALFGHEVGHTALHTVIAGGILQNEVVSALIDSSPLKSLADMNAWLNSPAAPQEIKNELSHFATRTGRVFAFTEEIRNYWLIELICDLFGMLLFGPAFFAAHRAYLQPLHPNPYAINTIQATHPPFAVRHKMLTRLMNITGWNIPITSTGDGIFYTAETEMISHLLGDQYDDWADMFEDAKLALAVSGVRKIFAPHHSLAYSRISAENLVTLLQRFMMGSPPILASIDQDGIPLLTEVHISQTLYAGWVYWIGRQHFTESVPLDFLATNRLCDHALLQQRAINYVLSEGIV